MTEIPEHLRKRAEEARKRAEAKGAGGDAGEGGASEVQGGGAAEEQGGEAGQAASGSGGGKIPAHLLERSRAARERAGGGGEESESGGGGTAVATTTAAPPAAAGGPAAPAGTGPGGHTQRLLTVVKSGSIQDVKAVPQDKVHTWPHLLAVEFAAALFITAFLLIFSIFVNAPLLELANPNETPNPSKAPWYFLGLQELLTMFHPMVAGVLLPGLNLVLLILAPYIDRNPGTKPEDRKFAVTLMTVHLMFWAVLTMNGSFFRGPGQNFIFPWNDGIWFHL